jgi:hypothetical protein
LIGVLQPALSAVVVELDKQQEIAVCTESYYQEDRPLFGRFTSHRSSQSSLTTVTTESLLPIRDSQAHGHTRRRCVLVVGARALG